jgi:beta-aspartyl-peptidase (threonine type)
MRPGISLFILSLCLINHAVADENRYAIVIHGGAMGQVELMDAQQRAAQEQSMRKALTLGRDILAKGGSSLDAVEQVIRRLEDDPLFNAGRGAVLNSNGQHELDASIMDGRDLSCGAVAGVRTVKNPISLARLVMTRTRHVLLAGDGAEKFADEMKVDRETDEYFRTQQRIDEWKRKKQEAEAKPKDGGCDPHMGTVGCVALDRQGNLAAGTSTGGLAFKKYGRIGDSPIIAAGTYASNKTCAVSCTGVGEEFIRRAVSFDISAQMQYQQVSLEEAVRTVIAEKLPPATGGVIAVSHDGQISVQYNTPGMVRAMADNGGRFEVVVK